MDTDVPTMIPVGWMLKKIAQRPDWLKTGTVKEIYSVSDCISENFADFVNFWKHNGYWLFDAPEIMAQLAKEQAIDLAGHKLFYYEALDKEYDEIEKKWQPFEPEESFTTNIRVPDKKKLEGFDVVTFCAHTDPEHSPLSCNSMAEEIPVNEHCLLASFDEAKTYLETDKFKHCERGPMRIFAVYSVEE